MKIFKFPQSIFPALFTILCLSSVAQDKVGIFDGHGDVGTNVKPGSATFIPKTGQYVITAPVTMFGATTTNFISSGKK